MTRWIRGLEHEADHALDLGAGQSIDTALWALAAATDAVIISKDEDFADLVRRSVSGPCVVWLRTGNGTTTDLIAYLENLWPAIEGRLLAGERLVEVR